MTSGFSEPPFGIRDEMADVPLDVFETVLKGWNTPMSDPLATLLGPINSLPEIGEETSFRVFSGFTCYKSVDDASYRYLFRLHSAAEPTSGLQIVTNDHRRTGQVAKVFTLPEWRRQHQAHGLLEFARHDFQLIRPSLQLTDDGYAWTKACWPRYDIDRDLWRSANEHFKRLPFIKGCASGIDAAGCQILPVIRIGMEDKVSELPEVFNHIRVFPRFERDE